jgi:hypothetical protein
VILSELHESTRVPRGPEFVSDCRLGKCAKDSGGERLGPAGKKLGKAPLRWPCAQAAGLFLRQSQPGEAALAPRDRNHGNAKALPVLAPQLGRAVEDLLRRGQPFELQRFVTASPLRGATEPAV